MSFGAIVFLVVFFAIFRVMVGIAKAVRRLQPPDGARPAPRRAPGDAPQTMAELLAEMRQQLEAARDAEREQGARHRIEARTIAPKAPRRLPAGLATRRSTDLSLESGSLETVPVAIDLDEGAEAVVQRRIAAAEARNAGRSDADHARFDATVRSAAPVVSTPPSRTARLRRAMIWREVLSPPISLRGDGER